MLDDPDRTVRTMANRGVHRVLDAIRSSTDGDLELRRVLGKGGQATVHEAYQPAMRRVVAVKHTTETSPDDDRDALVQEAWLTAALGHPNIPPIHDIQSIDGEPHVVMKKIDGQPWATFIDQPHIVLEQFGESDALGWNLAKLMTVCRAVEYAHSHQILHLDLKPANVMIGNFGEVWVVDWGVAASMDSEGPSHLMRTSEMSTPFGTPSYLAPEMADPTRPLTPATDVFLLGGILHRSILGRSPRGGRSALEVLARVHEPIPIPEDVPLADLLRRALHPDPAERPPTVAAFRRELEEFLRHRGALQLLERASHQLIELTHRLGADAPRTELYDVYGACRFGFEEALRTFEGLDAAVQGRRSAVELMTRYELDAGDDRAAEVLLSLLDEPSDDLVARTTQVRAEREAAREQLREWQNEQNPRTAWRARAVIGTVVGCIYVSTPIGTSLLGLPQGYAREIGIAGTTFLLTSVMMLALWNRLIQSRLSRTILVGMALGPSLVVLMHIGCWLAGMDSRLAGTLELFLYFAMVTIVMFLSEWRLFPCAAGYLIAYYLSMGIEGTTLVWMNLANLGLLLNVLVLWLPAGFRNEMPEDVPLL